MKSDMAIIRCDTHLFLSTLTASGIPENQAQAILQAVQKIDLQNVATREDIVTLRQELLKLRGEIFKWIVPLLLGQTLLFVGLNKILYL